MSHASLSFIRCVAIAASMLVPLIRAMPGDGHQLCNAEYDCGRPSICPTRCAFAYPCTTDDDCESRSCSNSYCDASAGEEGFDTPPPFYAPDMPDPNIGPGPAIVCRSAGACSTETFWQLTNFNRRSLSAFGIANESFGLTNRRFSPDPASPNGQPIVLEVFYPAGSVNPLNKFAPAVGGTGFYAQPINLSGARTVTFDFEVYFPRDFNFVIGGKLPGLYGGHVLCSGGLNSSRCFSTRYMWRKNGDAEIYLYLNFAAQAPSYCYVPPRTICDPKFGTSMGRGAWRWQRGQWNRVSQTVRLNTLGRTDGSVTVRVNGEQVISYNQIAWRTIDIGFVGIQFETFFGGSNTTWATPKDQSTYYKNIMLRVDKWFD
ncbi:hypothetical protein BC831DRAFT_547607 [Entophlyctis helioformis]|nr:hypothetical protein BC831DRAFT_547607 [Entophlyctis helioformis]